MPELKTRKQPKEEKAKKTKKEEVVSAYSKEGQDRIKQDNKRKKLWIAIGVSVYVIAVVVAILLWVYLP